MKLKKPEPKKPYYPYDLEFQEHILAAFLSNPEFWKTHLDVLEPAYFSDEVLSAIAQVIKEFYEKYKEAPSKKALESEVKKYIAPGRTEDEYHASIASVFNRSGHNTRHFQDHAIEFARTQAVSNALRDATEKLASGNIDGLDKLLLRASQVGTGAKDAPVNSYFERTLERARRYKAHKENPEGRIPTGFDPIDSHIQGGLAPGETGLFVALPKHGKSTTLVQTAVNAVVGGYRTLFVTCELSQRVIEAKFDTNFFGKNLDEIKKLPGKFNTAMQEARKKIRGSLTVLEFPPGRLTTARLDQEIGRHAPQIVFVDYVGKMVMPKREKDYRALADLHLDVQGVAGDRKVPLWTAHQVAKEGAAATTKIIEMHHIAGAYELGAIHDVLFSVNWTREQYRQHLMTMFCMGSRLGEAEFSFDCQVDFALSRIGIPFGQSDEDLG